MEPRKLINKKFKTAALLIFIIVLSACSSNENSKHMEKAAGTPVKTTHPVKTDLTEYSELNATTVFLNKEIVRATFPGFIGEVYKNIGDRVNKGDHLFLIRTLESSTIDSLNIQVENETFKGAVPVMANSNGTLTGLNYHTGDYITEGEKIAVIKNPSSLFISLNVPYQIVSQVDRNTNCIVKLPDGRLINAYVYNIIPSIDSASQTQKYLLKLKDNIHLPENLNVTVNVPVKKKKDILTVKRSAVMSNEIMTRFWVMKLMNDSTAVRVDIKKGIDTDSLVQIVDTKITINDQIIYSGAYGLPDTAKISVSK